MSSDLTVNRWQRYGHDRLYVNTGEGVSLGYWDRKTRTATVLQPARRDEFDDALWKQGPTALAASVEAAAVIAAPTVAVAAPIIASRPRYDLAGNRPGQGLLMKAAEARRERPVMTRLARLLGVHTHERADRVGAQGEIAVARRLDRLDDRWRVLHSISVSSGGRDIDHLVIGPSGVFSINAKHHPTARVWVANETLMVNGHRQRYVVKSRYEARHAAGVLGAALGRTVPVTGVIAIVGASKGMTIKEQPRHGEVVVTTRRAVNRQLRKGPERLTRGEVAEIYAIARLSTTWLPSR